MDHLKPEEIFKRVYPLAVDGLMIKVAEKSPDENATVIKVEVKGSIEAIQRQNKNVYPVNLPINTKRTTIDHCQIFR